MSDALEQKGKVRFRFRSGEEFEAEGNAAFIEQQRAYFLNLIGKQGNAAPAPSARRELPVLPAYERQRRQAAAPASELYPPQTEPASMQMRLSGEDELIGVARTDGYPRPIIAPAALPPAAESLWQRLVKTEEGLVLLRRKSRMLTPENAALVLIAAAKTLLKAEEGYSALNLSKSLKRSGYGEGRLDRTLAGEVKAGALSTVGSKRARAYKISDEGFARAFVLAEKLAEER